MTFAFGAAARRAILLAGSVALAASVPWWGVAALRQLAFFRVRVVEVEGSRYVTPGQIVDRLRIDTTASVWGDPGPLEARVRTLPTIRAVTISRQLPGTLVVRIVERTPIAFAPATGGLRVYDRRGTVLPIDPTRADLDLPIVVRPDSATLRLLGTVHDAVPSLYSEVSEVRPAPDGALIIQLSRMRLIAAPDVGVARFVSVPAVLADLARRRVQVQELDLRYRDQIVARLQ